MIKFFFLIFIFCAVNADTTADYAISKTTSVVERMPKIIDKILDEAKSLNKKFENDLVKDFVVNLKQLEYALKRYENEVGKKNNSFLTMQNLTLLIQVTYSAIDSLLSRNMSIGFSAIQESIHNIKRAFELTDVNP